MENFENLDLTWSTFLSFSSFFNFFLSPFLSILIFRISGGAVAPSPLATALLSPELFLEGAQLIGAIWEALELLDKIGEDYCDSGRELLNRCDRQLAKGLKMMANRENKFRRVQGAEWQQFTFLENIPRSQKLIQVGGHRSFTIFFEFTDLFSIIGTDSEAR